MTYLLFAEDARFYLDGGCYGDWYGKYNYEWLSKETASVDGIVKKWKEAGFRYVLVNHERAVSAQSIFFPGFADSAFTRPSFDLPGAERLFSDGRYSVFRLE